MLKRLRGSAQLFLLKSTALVAFLPQTFFFSSYTRWQHSVVILNDPSRQQKCQPITWRVKKSELLAED